MRSSPADGAASAMMARSLLWRWRVLFGKPGASVSKLKQGAPPVPSCCRAHSRPRTCRPPRLRRLGFMRSWPALRCVFWGGGEGGIFGAWSAILPPHVDISFA